MDALVKELARVPGADADERAAGAGRDLPLLLRARACGLRSLVQALRERRRSLLWWTLGLVALVGAERRLLPVDPRRHGAQRLRQGPAGVVRGALRRRRARHREPGRLPEQPGLRADGAARPAHLRDRRRSGAVAGEEERGTLDLLLAHPLRRRDYVVQRFLALAALVARAVGRRCSPRWRLGSSLVDLEIGFGPAGRGLGERRAARAALRHARARGRARSGRDGRGRSRSPSGVAVAAWIFDGLGQAVDALEPWRPLSPYYHALGQQPAARGRPAGRAGRSSRRLRSLLAAVAAAGLERRDLRQ